MNIMWVSKASVRLSRGGIFVLLVAVAALFMSTVSVSSASAASNAGGERLVLEKYKYKDYQGYVAEHSKDTLLVVGFFASWCPYCAEEFPIFAAENVQLNKKGQCVSFLGANMQDSYKPAMGFIEKAGVNFDTVMLDKTTVAKLFIRGVPTTLFYSNGKLVDMVAGTVDIKALKAHIKAYGGPNC